MSTRGPGAAWLLLPLPGSSLAWGCEWGWQRSHRAPVCGMCCQTGGTCGGCVNSVAMMAVVAMVAVAVLVMAVALVASSRHCLQ